MTKRQFFITVLTIICASILVGGLTYSSIVNNKARLEADLKKSEIENKTNLERTRERMNWIPWYSSSDNKFKSEEKNESSN